MNAGEHFASLASLYCAAIDNAAAKDRHALILELRPGLADLYAAALRLPVLEPIEELQIPGRSHEEWQRRYEALCDQLGDWNAYRSVLDPHGEDRESDLRMLADDLADIWRDLVIGLDLLNAGAPLEAAIVEWQLNFEIHWGEHALSALRALYSLVEQERSGFPSPQASGVDAGQS